MLVRLGLSLTLSLCLAVLLAWGWDRSDPPQSSNATRVESGSGLAL
jgi:hypothetical protein